MLHAAADDDYADDGYEAARDSGDALPISSNCVFYSAGHRRHRTRNPRPAPWAMIRF